MTAQPRWTAAGVVAAPVEQVAGLLLTVTPGRVTRENNFLIYHAYLPQWNGREVIVHGSGDRCTASVGRTEDQPGSRDDVDIEIDRAANAIQLQGHWWYRGVHSVLPHERGSLVRHEVYNIAPGAGRWAIPLMQMGFGGKLRAGMGALLNAIGQRLHCSTELSR